jgi:hypothetical protein
MCSGSVTDDEIQAGAATSQALTSSPLTAACVIACATPRDSAPWEVTAVITGRGVTRIVLSIEERIAPCPNHGRHSRGGVPEPVALPLPTNVALTITDTDRMSPRAGEQPVALARHHKAAPD